VTAPDVGSLVLVLLASTLAAIAARLHHRLLLPTVVVELVLGILIGPEVLDIADSDAYIEFLANIGLVFLFFFAGLEVIEKRVPRRELALGTAGWAASLAIGLTLGGVLHEAGLEAEGWLLGVALATTALGALVPILSDSGLLTTPLGRAVLGRPVSPESSGRSSSSPSFSPASTAPWPRYSC
jgi:Kef-type K+ transport system membrane component KefB